MTVPPPRPLPAPAAADSPQPGSPPGSPNARAGELVAKVAAAAGLCLDRVQVEVAPGPGAAVRRVKAAGPGWLLTVGADLLAADPQGAEAVLAHELGHIAHRDHGFATLAMLAQFALCAATPVLLAGAGAHRLAGLAGLAAGWLLVLAALACSRRQETRADAYAARLGYAETLIARFAGPGPARPAPAWHRCAEVFFSHPAHSTRAARLRAR